MTITATSLRTLSAKASGLSDELLDPHRRHRDPQSGMRGSDLHEVLEAISSMSMQDTTNSEANLIMDLVRAKREVFRAQKALAECILQENEVLSSLLRFQVETAETTLDDADMGLGTAGPIVTEIIYPPNSTIETPQSNLSGNSFMGSNDPEVQASIAETKGVRMSILDRLPTWNGSSSIPTEIMHLFWGPGKRSDVTPMDRLTEFLESIWWPNNSGRFQIKIASGGERPKADEWRNFMRVYPVAISVAWQMWSRHADDEAPPPKKRSKIQQAINVSRDEDAEAEDYLALEDIESHLRRPLELISEAFQSWAQLNCHLTPNFHFASHLVEYIHTYGPAYAWWVFPYERAIGVLGKANHNGHGSGEYSSAIVLTERRDQTEQDQLAICALLKAVKGGAEADRQRGTLMNYIALLSNPHNSTRIVFPKQFKLISLRPLGVYAIVLQFLRLHFPEFNLTSDAGEASNGIPFDSQGVQSYANVTIGAAKYGSFHHHLNIPRQDPPISVNVSLIRCFEHHPQDANHPWSLWATDLGIATWKYNVLGSLEACHLDDLSGQFAFSPVHAPRIGRLWVTFSLDTTSQEPDNSNP
ncbi:hypothetical protein DEU56DRAFT_917205 [Suillus clintonianus]|uniref:uncharacterized protein n=1 Tax=Suillus clintonianus TaxID=1904413 RepID=UPI001B86BE88|nr:uncharacterized protein DEU56DRAFT_917205 [Suillus clintonianus]KAG2123988.1 hypothetical protein DEU56DRAFT_917205 [Suillus clintonianus]